MPAEMRPFHLEGIRKRFLWKTLSKWVGKAGGHPQLALVASIAPVQPFPKFDRFIFRRAMDVACFSSIDRLQFVCFVKGNSLFPLTIPSAELNQLDHSYLRRAAIPHPSKKPQRHRFPTNHWFLNAFTVFLYLFHYSPCAVNTTPTVLKIIFQSNQKVLSCMY